MIGKHAFLYAHTCRMLHHYYCGGLSFVVLFVFVTVGFKPASAQESLKKTPHTVSKQLPVQQVMPQKNDFQNIRFRTLGVDEGMSQNSVLAVLQDKQGFIWSGSYDGLNRYDGTGFHIFRHSISDKHSLPKNWVTALCEDAAGTLWVGTNGGGLARYNAAKRDFISFRADSILLSNEITALFADKEQMLWIGTSLGLCRMDIRSGVMTRFSNICATPLPSQVITTLAADKEGNLWIGTRNGFSVLNQRTHELRSFDLAQMSMRQQAQFPTKQFSKPTSNALVNLVQVFLQDASGTMWIGTRGAFFYASLQQNLFESSPNQALRVLPVPVDDANPTLLASGNVQSLLEDRAGNFWVGTKNGLHLFNRSNLTATRFQHIEDDMYSIGDNFVMAMLQDRSGVLWFGTSGGGFSKYDPFSHRFPLINSSSRSPILLTDDDCNAFAEDDTGTLWIGTEKGINIAEKGKRTVRTYTQANTPLLGNDHIRTLAFDKRRRMMWIGTDNGLNSFDLTNNVWKLYRENPANTASLVSNRVISLALDDAGTLWVGTFDGASNFVLEENRWRRFQAENTVNTSSSGKFLSLTSNLIFGIVPEKDGTVWLGTDGGGVNRLDARTGKVLEVIRSRRNDSTTLPSDYVLFLGNDVSGEHLLIGTDGGLSVYDKRTKTLQNYGAKDGLPNEIINAVLPDELGQYWLSTNKGLSCLNPQSRTVRNFDRNDGLQSNEFNTGAFLRCSDGSLIFGGIQGFNRIYPGAIPKNEYAPPVVFTGFRKFNKSAVLDTAIEIAHEITLPYSENTLTFEFAALSYTFPERNSYKYMLEGAGIDSDDAWIDAGKRHEATYTNLDGGTYTFRVIAANSDGKWSESEARVRLVIVPPLWRTWWFRAALGLGIIVFAVGVYWQRLQLVKHRNAELERLVRVRTAALTESESQLVEANSEIKRQLEILSEQTVEIELANSGLQTMNVELAQLNEEKNMLLGVVAHDLKTPLSGVILATSNLEAYWERMSRDQIFDRIKAVKQTSLNMVNFIEDLLDVSAIDSGNIRLRLEAVALKELAEKCVDGLSDYAASKHIHLVISEKKIPSAIIPGREQWRVVADYRRTAQILENLLSNAIKFSPQNSTVTLEIARKQAFNEETRNEVIIAVKDEGPGISPEDQAQLFGKFVRLSAKPTGGEHSSGLGLAIVRRLAEAMQGAVWCESELGKGATFFVALPAE